MNLNRAKNYFAINWQLLLAKLLVVVLWSGLCYFGGVHFTQKDQLEEKATAAETAVQNINQRLPVVTAQEKQAADQAAKLASLQEKYDALVNSKPDNPDCAISPDELRYLQELSGR